MSYFVSSRYSRNSQNIQTGGQPFFTLLLFLSFRVLCCYHYLAWLMVGFWQNSDCGFKKYSYVHVFLLYKLTDTDTSVNASSPLID